MRKIVYKREEIGYGLASLIELKNTLGYSVAELTEALGCRGDIVYKALKRGIPVLDDIYYRAEALLELNKIQSVRGREQEIRDRAKVTRQLQKYIGGEDLAKRLELETIEIENINNGRILVNDDLYKNILNVLDIVELERTEEAERRRKARLISIEDAIGDLKESINKLELTDFEELELREEEYYSLLRTKKRNLKRLIEAEKKGSKEVTPTGGLYRAV